MAELVTTKECQVDGCQNGAVYWGTLYDKGQVAERQSFCIEHQPLESLKEWNGEAKQPGLVLEVPQKAPEGEINTHGLRITFGKHKGERWTRVPVGYLVWLVNERTQWAKVAQAELDRRGYRPPSDIRISDHAIDRASLYCRKAWHETSDGEEGLMSWLKRVSAEALAGGEDVTGSGERQENVKSVKLHGIKFVFAIGELYPTLKTVIRKRDPVSTGSVDKEGGKNGHN